MNTQKIRGVNLGNWLVLEKWMSPETFEGTDAEDETWLYRKMDIHELSLRIQQHRDTYITKQDFQYIAAQGLNLVRIPVPYFIFGDRPPFIGCIEYLDLAFDWAEKYQLQILIDLHTTPGSQNGFDNGGLTGVCKWHKNESDVEFVLTVLERLAERYRNRKELYGIEVLNEPVARLPWMLLNAEEKAVDKEEFQGSDYVPTSFLKKFYQDAYHRLRTHLPVEKVIVFQDGFRLGKWKAFFVKNHMENVVLDTHIYLHSIEGITRSPKLFFYKLFLFQNKLSIKRAVKYTPVMIGEWCIANHLHTTDTQSTYNENTRRNIDNQLFKMQQQAWETSAGWIYWNYKLRGDIQSPLPEEWLKEWDFRICRKNEWLSVK